MEFFTVIEINRVLCLPLSAQASAQLMELQDMINNMDWNHNLLDSWTYCWGSAQFSSKKAYSSLQGSIEASPIFSWVWKSGCLGHKFFIWLLIRNQLNTRNLLK
jgi:hypothetical protein